MDRKCDNEIHQCNVKGKTNSSLNKVSRISRVVLQRTIAQLNTHCNEICLIIPLSTWQFITIFFPPVSLPLSLSYYHLFPCNSLHIFLANWITYIPLPPPTHPTPYASSPFSFKTTKTPAFSSPLSPLSKTCISSFFFSRGSCSSGSLV